MQVPPPELAAARYFRETHRREPDDVWVAPGRVNLIGEHTDYNAGLAMPFALPRRVAVAASKRTDGVLTVASVGSDGALHRAEPLALASLEPGSVTGWSAYVAGVAWALAEAGVESAADLVLATDLPTGAGLSSSAALECASALALLALAGDVGMARGEIARITQRAENEFVGVPCGILDQTASLSCTAGHVLLFDARTGTCEQIPFDVGGDGLRILVIDTRVRHSLGESEYAMRRAACSRAAELLEVTALSDLHVEDLGQVSASLPAELARLARHVVTENRRVREVTALLDRDRIAEVGPLLDASHESLRDDYRVSSPELDLAVTAAREAGALGARMTGGGFGGSAIALVDAEMTGTVEQAVGRAFAREGLRAPRMFDAVPSAGAGRELLTTRKADT